jgi:hypothetical protein
VSTLRVRGPQAHPPGDHRFGQLDLEGHEAALRAHHHHRRHGRCLRQRQRGLHVGQPAGPAGTDAGQLVLHEGAEAAVQMHLRRDRVAGALQPRQQGLLEGGRLQQRALPEALLHPGAVEQVQVGDAEFGALAQDPPQHLRPRQGQHDVEAMPGRRRICECHPQARTLRVEGFDQPLAAQPTQQTHPQRVAHPGLQHRTDMPGAVIPQQHAIGVDPVALAQQHEIHRMDRHSRSAQ